jgi:hypothetical protein
MGVSGYVKVRLGTGGLVTVTGSAKQKITSDYAFWIGTFATQSKNLSEAYANVKKNKDTVKTYLLSKGISEKEITFQAVNTQINYVMGSYGNFTSEIDTFKLSQSVEIRSNNVPLITSVSKESTELMGQGIQFTSNLPQYYYTKIAELKIDMLAKATKDAKERAVQIASNTNTEIVGMKKSKMGVFQIMPLNSNTISDYGVDDTSSIEKEIMAVMNCEFQTK